MNSIIGKPLTRFRASPSRGASSVVERTGGDYGAGLIRGFSTITRGEARGYRQWVDRHAVESVIRLGNTASNGIKSRFTHPSLSGDGLGTVLGRVKDFRLAHDQALADLHFSKTAHETPDGDLATYVMDMAEEDPELFGASIVFEADYNAEKEFAAEHTENGRFQSPDFGNTNNFPHIRLAKLRATDIVDEPAANPGGLFRRGHEIAEEADRLVEFALGLSTERPILKFLDADADRLAQYAARFLEHNNLSVVRIGNARDAGSLFGPGPTSPETLRARLRAEYKRIECHQLSLGVTEEAYVCREIDRLCSGHREDTEISRLMKEFETTDGLPDAFADV